MKVEIITTGTELLLGELLNTNVQYLSRKLNNIGFDVLYHTTVGDNPERMRAVLEISSLPEAVWDRRAVILPRR